MIIINLFLIMLDYFIKQERATSIDTIKIIIKMIEDKY